MDTVDRQEDSQVGNNVEWADCDEEQPENRVNSKYRLRYTQLQRMIIVVTAAVLQGTRVSSGDSSESGSGSGGGGNGNGNANGTGTGREREREWERERDRQRTFRQRRTASDERVGQGDGQRQTDVSNRETDSVRRTCRTR